MSRVLGFTGHRDRGIDLPFQTEFFLLSSFLVYLESFNYSYLNRSNYVNRKAEIDVSVVV